MDIFHRLCCVCVCVCAPWTKRLARTKPRGRVHNCVWCTRRFITLLACLSCRLTRAPRPSLSHRLADAAPHSARVARALLCWFFCTRCCCCCCCCYVCLFYSSALSLTLSSVCECIYIYIERWFITFREVYVCKVRSARVRLWTPLCNFPRLRWFVFHFGTSHDVAWDDEWASKAKKPNAILSITVFLISCASKESCWNCIRNYITEWWQKLARYTYTSIWMLKYTQTEASLYITALTPWYSSL